MDNFDRLDRMCKNCCKRHLCTRRCRDKQVLEQALKKTQTVSEPTNQPFTKQQLTSLDTLIVTWISYSTDFDKSGLQKSICTFNRSAKELAELYIKNMKKASNVLILNKFLRDDFATILISVDDEVVLYFFRKGTKNNVKEDK